MIDKIEYGIKIRKILPTNKEGGARIIFLVNHKDDGDTDGTVTDMGAISIIPIPGEEGRLYRAVYHPHTPTYSHAKIASRTSIPAFDID